MSKLIKYKLCVSVLLDLTCNILVHFPQTNNLFLLTIASSRIVALLSKKNKRYKVIDEFIDIFKSLVRSMRRGFVSNVFSRFAQYIPSDGLRASGAIAQGIPFVGPRIRKKQKLTKIFFVLIY